MKHQAISKNSNGFGALDNSGPQNAIAIFGGAKKETIHQANHINGLIMAVSLLIGNTD